VTRRITFSWWHAQLGYSRRGAGSGELAEVILADIRRASSETEARGVMIEIRDSWDFEEVYALHAFARAYPSRPRWTR
jgi:transcriptional regulatory protein RtcR